jgi:hypothetical protein
MSGYDGLKARERSILRQARTHLTDPAARLTTLYEAKEVKDMASDWKKIEEREREKK